MDVIWSCNINDSFMAIYIETVYFFILNPVNSVPLRHVTIILLPSDTTYGLTVTCLVFIIGNKVM